MRKQTSPEQIERHGIDGRIAAPGRGIDVEPDESEQRDKARSDRYSALTGLRGLAALGVFAVHAYAVTGYRWMWPGNPSASFVLGWLPKMGWAGVDVFFTLSAFLLTLPYARAQIAGSRLPGLRDYAQRRALRILPAYFAQLLVLYVLIALGWSAHIVGGAITPARLLVQPIFGYDFGWPGGPPMQGALVGSWWTLPVEIGFYLLLPLLARLLRPGRWRWLLVAIAFAWIWRAALLWTLPNSIPQVYLVEHLPGRIDQFAIGMLAAYACCRAPRALEWINGARADALFALAAAAFFALPALGYVQGFPVGEAPRGHWLLIGWHSYASVLVALMLVASARGAPQVKRIVGSLPLRLFGHISYGLFLWHLPILIWLRAIGGIPAAGGALIFTFDCLMISIVMAIVSWALVERPALRRARRLPGDARDRMPTPVPVRAP